MRTRADNAETGDKWVTLFPGRGTRPTQLLHFSALIGHIATIGLHVWPTCAFDLVVVGVRWPLLNELHVRVEGFCW